MTTRLSKEDSRQSMDSVLQLLNNIPQFVDIPVKDRTKFCAMYNSKFPPELVGALSKLGEFGILVGGEIGINQARLTVDFKGGPVSALVLLDNVGPPNAENAKKGELQTCIGLPNSLLRQQYGRQYRVGIAKLGQTIVTGTTVEMTPGYICDQLGEETGLAFLEWMQTCAVMFDELKTARQTVIDIFEMAKTAGQIKRMVPDLMQYIPAEQRKAFDNQKQASKVPFEWAPYPKKNIDDMLLQVSKGHLLKDMAKEGRSDVTVANLNAVTWARRVQWHS